MSAAPTGLTAPVPISGACFLTAVQRSSLPSLICPRCRGGTGATAPRNTLAQARQAKSMGYCRFPLAGHHKTPGTDRRTMRALRRGSGGQLCAGCHAGAGYCGNADPQPGSRAIPGIGRLAPVRVPGSCLCGARQAAHSDLPCAIALNLLRGNLQQAFANLCRAHPGKLLPRRRPTATAAAGSPRLCRGDWGSRRGRCHDCRRGCTVADAAD
jgi:hypothetical protein